MCCRREYFHAVLYPRELTSLPMLYDVVRCSGADAETRRNLWDCAEVRPAVSGRCDPVTNAAGVTCEPLPAPTDPVASQSLIRCQHARNQALCRLFNRL